MKRMSVLQSWLTKITFDNIFFIHITFLFCYNLFQSTTCFKWSNKISAKNMGMIALCKTSQRFTYFFVITFKTIKFYIFQSQISILKTFTISFIAHLALIRHFNECMKLNQFNKKKRSNKNSSFLCPYSVYPYNPHV